jgi:lipopolysaccharide/colanic/teichoic acid biosynthesis glycosyltransferase
MPIMDSGAVSTDGAAGAIAVELREAYPTEVGHWAPLVGTESAGRLAREERHAELKRAANEALKRSIDVAISASILFVTAPLIALVALLIVIESPGPVFYKAERIGRNGTRLRMLKFRKMRNDAKGNPLTLAQDARFTRIGKFLAKAKIDEIPQLFNVLKGEMSLIGPRPEDPSFVAERPEDYAEILKVRPGVTGLSQIAFAEESEILCKIDPMGHYRDRIFPQKIGLDKLYASHPSIRVDFWILFWTAAAVLMRRDVAVHRETGRMNLRRR